jgi:L-lactate utilization protein LutC
MVAEKPTAPAAHQEVARADNKKVVDVRDLNLYVEPIAYYDEKQVENAHTTDLRQQLSEAEVELEGATTWVEAARAEENIRTLRRELGFSEYARPWATHHNLVGVERVTPAEQRFVAPETSFTDRAECEARAEKFARRTGQ